MNRFFGIAAIAVLCVATHFATRTAMSSLTPVVSPTPTPGRTCPINSADIYLDGFTVDGIPYDADDRLVNGIWLTPGNHTVQVTWYYEVDCGTGGGYNCGVCVESRVYQFDQQGHEIVPNVVPYTMGSQYGIVADCGQAGSDVKTFTFTIFVKPNANGQNTDSYIVAARLHQYDGTKCDGTCALYGGEASYSFAVPAIQ